MVRSVRPCSTINGEGQVVPNGVRVVSLLFQNAVIRWREGLGLLPMFIHVTSGVRKQYINCKRFITKY